ncbi:MAG: hypothetical protein JWM98_2911 [Thermoleophilia bacterium]|nr:hypothetical protein [Thermoleophilia bacterium]
MTTARSSQVSARDVANVAWERRRRAAWLDYLRIVREVDRSEYEGAETNAWELLQRRLRRNDELRSGVASSDA